MTEPNVHDLEEAAARKAIRKRLNAARWGMFPHKTCPASRHAHLIIDGLLDPKSDMHKSLKGFEPEHMAESLACVLAGLWAARKWMIWDGTAWVPDPAQFRTDRENKP